MIAIELAKYVVYRTPLLALVGPRYPYYLNPAELAFLCDAISVSKESGGAILEIGVAKGDTSIFLLEHLKTTNDGRVLNLVDTFSGFTQQSLDYEVRCRSKSVRDMKAFCYGDQKVFEKSIRRQGYCNFRTYAGDAAEIDYAQFAPIAVVLLDIDLYLPTKRVLDKIWSHMAKPGFILVDDCLPGTPWDGALVAYEEFVRGLGLPSAIVGRKGGIIRVT